VAQFKKVVTMYENMKAKDAAKIFDGLDMTVLLDVAKEINPRRMSDILALMTPENAQRLTIELAARAAQKDQPQAAELPKIQGRPTPN
jgi:flagellar motility protein MotE (MotC chaperone)